MRKSAMTWLLDVVRYLLIITGNAVVLCLFWTKANWVWAALSAIPVCAAVFLLADLLTLPLYLLTPECRAVSVVLKAIEEDDFDEALRVLEAYQKSDAGQLQSGRHVCLTQVAEEQSEIAGVWDDGLAQDNVRNLRPSCGELIYPAPETMNRRSLDPTDPEGLPYGNNAAFETDTPTPSTCEEHVQKSKSGEEAGKLQVNLGGVDENMVPWDDDSPDYYCKRQAIDDAKKVGREYGVAELTSMDYNRLNSLLRKPDCTIRYMSRTSPPRGKVHKKDWQKYIENLTHHKGVFMDAVEREVAEWLR